MNVTTRRLLGLGVPAFVWSVWGLMLLAAFLFVERYGSNLPLLDDWDMVSALTGEQSLADGGWLFQSSAGHRVPLYRLLFVGLYHLGDSFRVAMFVGVAALGSLSAALIVAARALRGRAACSDAFFPLVMLHWGHYGTFLWSGQIAFVVPVVVEGAFLLIMARRRPPGPIAVPLAGLGLLVLAACGPAGLAVLPALAIWVGAQGVRLWRAGDTAVRAAAFAAFGLAGVAALCVVGYVFTLEPSTGIPPSPGLGASLLTATQVLAGGLGGAAWGLWPLVGYGIVAVVATAGIRLLSTVAAHPRETIRAGGLLLVLTGCLCLALAIGWARAGLGPRTGLSAHYSILGVPLLGAAYLAWGLVPQQFGKHAQTLLFLGAGALLAANTRVGLDAAVTIRSQVAVLERDLLARLPPSVVAERHWRFQWPWSDSYLPAQLRRLRDAGIRPFDRMGPDPHWEELRLAAVAQPGAAGPGDGSGQTYTLPEPRIVYAFRLEFPAGQGVTPGLRVAWRRAGEADFRESELPPYDVTGWTRQAAAPTALFWVCDRLDAIRLQPPSAGGGLALQGLTLQVPPANDEPILQPCAPN